MGDALILIHTAIAIVLIIVLILALRIEPVLALVAGALYLGIATGLGFAGTAETIATGFGDVMAEIGLLIAFGVLLGTLLSATGALQRLSEVLLRTFGPERSPYALGVSLGAVFPAIFTDVLLVLAAPLARSLAPGISRNGTPKMAAALIIGTESGLVLMVPGAGTLALAGLLEVSLGTMLVLGLLIIVPTIVITLYLYNLLLERGLWNSEKDEVISLEAQEEGTTETAEQQRVNFPLYVLLLPLMVALLLIAAGGFAEAAGIESGLIAFLGDPLVALFLSLFGAYLLTWRALSNAQAGEAIENGFRASGIILILTGVGGSLAAVVGESGLEDILAGYFSAGAFSPLLLAWLIAAILHLAIGSVSVSAIAAAGILAPIVGDLEVSTVLVALAAGSGSLFAVTVTSNFFWLFQTLLGLSTQGTLKTCTLVSVMASVISLALILALSIVL